jgi:hypothetical protein
MINQIHKVIYIHPPKTGGWSVIDLYGSKSPIPEEEGKFENLPVHHSLKFYKNFGFNLDNYFIFATTRNPWDRVVSAFSWLKASGGGRLANNKKGKKCNFEEFVYWLEEERVTMFHNKNNRNWMHPNPIWEWVTIDNQVCVDYFCNLHTFRHDFDFVLDVLESKRKLPHSNRSHHDDYKKYYTSKLIDVVAKVFRKDIEYFKFKFEDKNYSDFDRVVNPEKIKKYREKRQLLKNGCTKI